MAKRIISAYRYLYQRRIGSDWHDEHQACMAKASQCAQSANKSHVLNEPSMEIS